MIGFRELGVTPAWGTAAWGLPVAGWTSAHMPALLRRQSSNSLQEDLLFLCMFTFVHRSATCFISSLSHYWISGLPEHMGDVQSAPAKRTLSPFTKPEEVRETSQHCIGSMAALESRSSEPECSTQRLRNQGVRTGSSHWIIGRLSWGSKSEMPCTVQTKPGRQRNQIPSQTKPVTLGSPASKRHDLDG